MDTALQRDERNHALAFQLIRPANDRSFRDTRMANQRAFDFRCAEPMPGHVQDIIDSADDPKISVLVAARAVASEVIAFKLAPVMFLVARFVAVNCPKHRWPRTADN